MSILVRFAPPNDTATPEKYDETIRLLEEQGPLPPDGQEYHCAFIVDGGLRVSEVWDSQEAFQAFGERLMPILEQVGIDPGQPDIMEVHNTIKR